MWFHISALCIRGLVSWSPLSCPLGRSACHGTFCFKDTVKAWGCLFARWSLPEWPMVTRNGVSYLLTSRDSSTAGLIS